MILKIRLPIALFFLACCFLPISLIAASVETVTNTNDMGSGSFRQAITDVDPGGEIVFNLPCVGPYTILVLSLLMVDKAMTITGPGGGIQVFIVSDVLAGQSEVEISRLTVDGGVDCNFRNIEQRQSYT